MSITRTISRRSVLAGLGSLSVAVLSVPVAAQGRPTITITKDPSCGCCGAWVDHVRASGFPVTVVESSEVNRLKERLGIPRKLESCHTAEVGGYVIEGHVPASAIERLLAEKPRAKGLAVPGMPVGAPGMEVEGMENETYDVVLFGSGSQRVFARYRGLTAV